MFFEMLFGYIIAFVLGALATIVLACYLVLDGDLIIEKTADKEARKERKRQKREERKREKREEEEANKKTARKKT